MTDYKTLKIPLKVWNIFDTYVQTQPTVNDSATAMIQDLIKIEAKKLLTGMIKQLEEKKGNWEAVKKQLDSIV